MRIGVDVGGTKIEIVALDSNGQALVRKRIPTPRNGYNAIIKTIVELVQQVESQLMQKATVGVATPGALSTVSQVIKNSNSQSLNGQPFDRDLGHALGRPVRLGNDANCFTLSEAIDGAAKEANVVFGVIIGTGTGGGIVFNKHMHTGLNAIAGEWGHNPLPWPHGKEIPGPSCYCGKKGCIETFLSGPGLANDYRSTTDQVKSPAQIAIEAGMGSEPAMASVKRYIDRLARALAGVINILDPDVIVLGGGLSNISQLYREVPLLWGRYVFSDHVNTLLKPAIHGDSSGVRGAAWLWPINRKSQI